MMCIVQGMVASAHLVVLIFIATVRVWSSKCLRKKDLQYKFSTTQL